MDDRPIWQHPALLAVGLYAICLSAAVLTEWLSALPGNGVSLWLPAGFLLAALIATPRRSWPYWALASGAAELTGNALWYQHEIPPALLFACGNVLAAIVGALAIKRITDRPHIFTSLRSTLRFIIIAVFLVPSISATVGSVALSWSYGTAPFAAWQRIMLGDATGAMVAAPFALLVFGAATSPLRFTRARTAEATLLVISFGAMAAVSLGGYLPFAFLMIPPILWAALRFRAVGAIVASAALMLFTALFTVAKISPFSTAALYAGYSHEGLQLFLLVAAITALMIGALAEEMRQAVKHLYSANKSLEATASKTAGLLSAIGDASPDLIFAKDLDSRIVYANNATLRALGADSVDDLVGNTGGGHFFDNAEHDLTMENDQKVLTDHVTLICEEPVTGTDGTKRVYRSTKSPLFDSSGKLTGLAGVSVDITDLKKSEQRERMLVREVEHRARNLLAIVQGLVHLTSAETLPEFRAALASRIRALARTNGAIAASNWQGAGLRQIVLDELSPYGDEASERVVANGEDVILDPATAQSMTLVLHELATNAAKYGALSWTGGRLAVHWTREDGDAGQMLTLHWREKGGPAVEKPSRRGFGTDVIETFAHERPGGGVNFDWAASGLEIILTVPLASFAAPRFANDDPLGNRDVA